MYTHRRNFFCILSLLFFVFFSFAHAANPPTLTSYTVSHDTIYPTATVESGLAITTSIDIAFSEQVKVSMKIVSSDGVMIKSLYSSSSVTNPTAKVWDGTNTDNIQVPAGTYTILISATSTATNLTMTDSSRTITVASLGSSSSSDATPPDSSSATSTSEVQAVQSSGGGTPEYLPIPTLRIITDGDRTVSSGADTAFTAVVYDGKGNKRDDAIISWSFGDGMQKVGSNVFHTYYGPGEYLAIVRVTTSDGGSAFNEIVITVKDASIKITSVSARGITLTNNDSRTLDLSLWRLSMGGQEFKIPADTKILAGHSILFPSQVIELPIDGSASLLYPSGEVAAVYSGTSLPVKLSSSNASTNIVQAVEPIISTKTDVQSYGNGVKAPAAATDLAAAGAALPETPPSTSTSASGPLSSIMKSPWTLGSLGIVILTGAAFILL